MSPSQTEEIVRRLVANPHDEAALAEAHAAGQQDARGYAMLLERVGDMSADQAYSSHWLAEAANVWALTLGDARRAAMLLMRAIEKDPSSETASDRLAALYREKGDHRALAALYERRAKALAPLAKDPRKVHQLSVLHEQLGRLWQEPTLAQPRKAVENFRKAFELDPGATSAIYSAREILKAQGDYQEALPLYDLEIQSIDDLDRRLLLLRDEVSLRTTMGDARGASSTLRDMRRLAPEDAGLAYELGSSIVARLHDGEPVPIDERAEAAELLAAMAEQYEGEHAIAYAEGALDALPGHDRAMQLASYFAQAIDQADSLADRWVAYLNANPTGLFATDARMELARMCEAAGNLEEAIAVLEPLSDSDDPSVEARLSDLYARAGQTSKLASHLERHAGGLPPPERAQRQLEIASLLVSQGDKAGALAKYQEVLAIDPQHPEALTYVEDELRSARRYRELRDTLMAAARVTGASVESRKSRIREAATLSEVQLNDIDAAAGAYRQLLSVDRADDGARASLYRLLERGQRWDDLASALEQEATAAASDDQRIAGEKRLAELHETKRDDNREAAAALLRVVRLDPADHASLARAVDLLLRCDETARAASALDESVGGLPASPSKAGLLFTLGELREQMGDSAAAARAFEESAQVVHDPTAWRRAEESAVRAERWDIAATAARRRGEASHDPNDAAGHRTREAEYLVRGGDAEAAIARLELLVEAAPGDDATAEKLESLYEREGRLDEIPKLLARRAEHASESTVAVALLRRAARLRQDRLVDTHGAREVFRRIATFAEDPEALAWLADDAASLGEAAVAVDYLNRLQSITDDPRARVQVALRAAALLADGLSDVDAAVARYTQILDEFDEGCREALQAIADLEETRDHFPQAADALERDLELASGHAERAAIARRLGEIYVQHTRELGKSIAAYEVVVREDQEDFVALQKLRELCERAEQWPRVVELLEAQLEVEGDEGEIAELAARRAEIQADQMGRVEEALRGLAGVTSAGSEVARATALAIADRHDAHAQVGGQVLAWARTSSGSESQRLLGEAFDRFVRGGAVERALEIAPDVLHTPRGRDASYLADLEPLAVQARDLELVLEIHDRRASLVAGAARCEELLRQAEARIALGVPAAEAVEHAELGLGSIPAAEAAPRLARIAAMAPSPLAAIEVYERQVSRCRTASDRAAATLAAFRRAAEALPHAGEAQPPPGEAADARDTIAAKCESLIAGALAADVGDAAATHGRDDALEGLYAVATDADAIAGGDAVRRRVLAGVVAPAGGARDAIKARARRLRVAAGKLLDDLGDAEQAVDLLAASIVSSADAASLDAVEAILGGDASRMNEVLGRALDSTFDGPVIRLLLARRALIRHEKLDDIDGALADAKRLHELAPADAAVTERYASLLRAGDDYRGLIHLLEDRLLRTKEQPARADLAREIARLWEERLGEPRETADAWRRVLRLSPSDVEGAAGLERAKRNKLKFVAGAHPPQRHEPPRDDAAAPAPPPITSDAPPARSALLAGPTEPQIDHPPFGRTSETDTFVSSATFVTVPATQRDDQHAAREALDFDVADDDTLQPAIELPVRTTSRPPPIPKATPASELLPSFASSPSSPTSQSMPTSPSIMRTDLMDATNELPGFVDGHAVLPHPPATPAADDHASTLVGHDQVDLPDSHPQPVITEEIVAVDILEESSEHEVIDDDELLEVGDDDVYETHDRAAPAQSAHATPPHPPPPHPPPPHPPPPHGPHSKGSV